MQPYRTDELNKLARMSPYLDEESLKARLVAQSLMGHLEVEAEQKLEDLLKSFLTGIIDRDAFIKKTTARDEGIGLYHASAEELADEIIAVLGMSKFLKKSFGNFPRRYEEYSYILERISSYLLLATRAHLTDDQLERFRSVIKGRMEGSLTKRAFCDILDAPMPNGGVGLNIRTARAISERLGLIMVDFQLKQQEPDHETL